ncbi:MAG: hypothetical protein E6102_03275 [Negativicoccus succinicivorans]|uniref:hypothetical protein n=1 Tax=Negativicoccus succinicivorans TaxID=620903 RepID=UPI00290A077F|nr:hypothetical protein [Negativicoccus succinicivorans]MDU5395770.1 hypothetical protein [Negativicoccus succinicivorans]
MANLNINELQDKVLAGELTVSQSPYSDSWYIMKPGEEISWGEKPEGSYRIADHWNFGSDNEHCRLAGEEDKVNREMVCEYRDGFYYEVKDADPEVWAQTARQAFLTKYEKEKQEKKERIANLIARYTTAEDNNMKAFDEEKKAVRKAETIKSLMGKLESLLTASNFKAVVAEKKNLKKEHLLYLVAALEANQTKANEDIAEAAKNGNIRTLAYEANEFTATFNKEVIAYRVLIKIAQFDYFLEKISHVDLERFAEEQLGAMVETSVGYYFPEEAINEIK